MTTVMRELQSRYRPPRTFLAWRTPLDLLVATILSAQCTDARVNRVVREVLYPKYKTARDYVRVPRSTLERDIRPCGFFRMKAKHIQELCEVLLRERRGEVPRTMEALTALPGVGRKTAAIILWVGFGKNEGIAVDTHVLRLSRRLGLSRGRTPEQVERDLLQALPRRSWGRLTTLMISHGRAVCTARARQCQRCVFQHRCPSSLVLGSRDLAKA